MTASRDSAARWARPLVILAAIGLVYMAGSSPSARTDRGTQTTAPAIRAGTDSSIGTDSPTTAGAGADPSRSPLRVDVVGDSLTVQSSPNIEAALTDAGYIADVKSWPGVDLSSDFVQARLREFSGDAAEILVIATASNDAVKVGLLAGATNRESARRAYLDSLIATLDRFSDRCIVMVGARTITGALYYPDQATDINQVLRDQEASRSMFVVDWASISASHDEWFIADRLHVGPDPFSSANTLTGAHEYAKAIRAGVDRCAALVVRAG